MDANQTEYLRKMKDERNYSLLPHNTFGIEAVCRRYVEFSSMEEARETAALLRHEDTPFLIIGRGSNLLLTRDFEGIVVRSAIDDITLQPAGDHTLVRVGSGMEWDAFVAWCVEHDLHGAENLSLIPGDVGASAVQNIGAYGAEAADIIYKVEAVRIADGQQVELKAEDCAYGYRQSRFKHEWKNQYLITHVVYRLSSVFVPQLDYGNIRAELQQRGIGQPTAQALRDVIIAIRQQKLPDPQVLGNAGSFFMNPVVGREVFERLQRQYPEMPHYPVDALHEKIPAAWLIDQCGWKGRSLGRAGVHDRQALVLVNRGGASGSEVVTLCHAIQADVRQRFGIEISPEVNIV